MVKVYTIQLNCINSIQFIIQMRAINCCSIHDHNLNHFLKTNQSTMGFVNRQEFSRFIHGRKFHIGLIIYTRLRRFDGEEVKNE